MSEERWESHYRGVGPNLEESVLPVLNKVVVLEVLDEEAHKETGVGECRLMSINRVPEGPWSSEDHRLYGLRNRLLENWPSHQGSIGPEYECSDKEKETRVVVVEENRDTWDFPVSKSTTITMSVGSDVIETSSEYGRP